MILLTDMLTPFKFGPYDLYATSNGYVVMQDTHHARAAILHWKELKTRPVIRDLLNEAIEKMDTIPTLRDLLSMRFGVEVLGVVKAGLEPWPDLPAPEPLTSA